MGSAFINYAEIDEPASSVFEVGQKPGRDLAEYRYRLNRARRQAARDRLIELITLIDGHLPGVVQDVPPQSGDYLETEASNAVRAAIKEIERLIGDSVERQGRWNDLHRHLAFGEGHDWHDIRELDWPSVKPDIEAALFSDTEPLPVPEIDLGTAAADRPTGPVSTALKWNVLSADDFERLLFDLLQNLPGHQNVQWLMRTNASDRGRDLSVDRVIHDGAGGVRVERVIVQAKHWLSRSVNLAELNTNVANVALWEPPSVHGLIVATSGRFTTDAVAWSEKHNADGKRPLIDLWPESRLETLLSQHPHLVAAHGLR